MKKLFFGIVVCCWVACTPSHELPPPNILWLVSEDNSPMLGCYGDEFATTPHLDAFAKESFLYSHAYANAPVCAPARNAIITGMYPNSLGNQHMRSSYPTPDFVKFLPEYLKELGYFCTNNAKTDYNTSSAKSKEIWDQSNERAHYKNRPEGQPFFAVFNSHITHESSLHVSIPDSLLRHSVSEVPIPPYHPRTKEMEQDWAQYYDKVEDMDSWVGRMLKELDESDLSENTIVFYYADHGGVLGRSKRFIYETGTHVPVIVRIPKKYKHLFPAKAPGTTVDRLISFVDLLPTLLSIVGTDIPDYLQGQPFLGDQTKDDPEYAFMFRGRMDERYDMSRSVRNKKYRYIKNYMPHRIYGQKLEYLWNAPSMKSWEQAYKEGACDSIQSIFWNTKPVEELYDTENDPWEVNNLAANPDYQDQLVSMREANTKWIKSINDSGFIPEAELVKLSGVISPYEFIQKSSFDMDGVIEAANVSTRATEELIPQMISYLKDENSAIRYWGATGLLIIGEKTIVVKNELLDALNDESLIVQVVAAEAVYRLGATVEAMSALSRVINSGDEFAITSALNTVDILGIQDDSIIDDMAAMVLSHETINRNNYALRAARMLFVKYEINPIKYNIDFGW